MNLRDIVRKGLLSSYLPLKFFVFIFSVLMPFHWICDGTYRGTDVFGRIVAMNSFNREIAEDEAAVLS